jgi:hypothetical protein
LWAPVDPLPLVDPVDEPVVEFEMSAPPVPELILLEPGLPVVPVELEPDVPTELPVEVPAPPLALPCANARELVITSIAANPWFLASSSFLSSGYGNNRLSGQLFQTSAGSTDAKRVGFFDGAWLPASIPLPQLATSIPANPSGGPSWNLGEYV